MGDLRNSLLNKKVLIIHVTPEYVVDEPILEKGQQLKGKLRFPSGEALIELRHALKGHLYPHAQPASPSIKSIKTLSAI